MPAKRKRKKKCGTRFILEQQVMEVHDTGETDWGPLHEAKTTRGTIRKDFQTEARCRGLKLDVRRRQGQEPEVYLVPLKRGKRIPYPF